MQSRASLAAYLANEFLNILTAADMPATDTPEGFGPALDETEAALPWAASASPDRWQVPLARFYTVRRVASALADQIAIIASGANLPLNQLYDNVVRMLERERKTVAWILEGGEAPAGAVGAGGSNYGLIRVEFGSLGGEDDW